MPISPVAGLPQLSESQAGKYLTINEALRLSESIVCTVAKSATTLAEPASPDDGDVYVIVGTPTGTTWATFAPNSLAVRVNTAWREIVPNAKTRYELQIADNINNWLEWNGSQWQPGRQYGAAEEGTGAGALYKGIRLRIDSNHGHESIYVTDLEFRTVQGLAADHSGDTAFASSSLSASYLPEKAFDNATTTHWASPANPSYPQYLGLVLNAPVESFEQLRVYTNVGTSTVNVNSFAIEASLDTTDGVDGAWIEIESFTHAQTPDEQLFDVTWPASASASTPIRFIEIEITGGIPHGSFAFDLAILTEIRAFPPSSGINAAAGKAVSATSTLNGYSVAALTDDVVTSGNWANGAMPATVTIDLGVGNDIVLDRYSFVSAADGSNSPYYPTDWVVRTGAALGSMTQVDAQIGQVFTNAQQEKIYTIVPAGPAEPDTDGLPEGAVNLYYTETRVSANTDVVDNGTVAAAGVAAAAAAQTTADAALTPAEGDAAYVNLTGDTMSGDLHVEKASGTSVMRVEGTASVVQFKDLDMTAGKQAFRIINSAGSLYFQSLTDSYGAVASGDSFSLRVYHEGGVRLGDAANFDPGYGGINAEEYQLDGVAVRGLVVPGTADNVLTDGVATTATAVSMSPHVPLAARGSLLRVLNSGANTDRISLTDPSNASQWTRPSMIAGEAHIVMVPKSTDTQSVNYQRHADNGASSFTIDVLGYVL